MNNDVILKSLAAAKIDKGLAFLVEAEALLHRMKSKAAVYQSAKESLAAIWEDLDSMRVDLSGGRVPAEPFAPGSEIVLPRGLRGKFVVFERGDRVKVLNFKRGEYILQKLPLPKMPLPLFTNMAGVPAAALKGAKLERPRRRRPN